MGLIDFDKLARQYATHEDDFGFSAIGEDEYNARIANEVTKVTQPVESKAKDYSRRLQELENMIVPFLTKLHSTGDKEYIYWPNRKPAIEAQIEKILKLTRD
jgi:SPX domain protein involved in polyphosphate accumulation